MMMQGGAGGMPQGGPEPLKLQKKKPKVLPKLLDDKNGKYLPYLFINRGYQFYILCRDWTKSGLWMLSCFGLMFMFPMALEYMGEQNRILMKLQMQMTAGDMMGPPGG